MKKLISFILLLSLSGCSRQLKEADLNYLNPDGTILLNEKGSISNKISLDDQVILDLYIEPSSKSALNVLESLEETLLRLVEEDFLVLRYHPVMYMNDRHETDFSVKMATNFLMHAEFEPKSALSALFETYNESYVLENLPKETIASPLSEKTIKLASFFTPYALICTAEYVAFESHPILALAYNDTVIELDFKSIDKAQSNLFEKLGELYQEDDVKMSQLKALMKEKEA